MEPFYPLHVQVCRECLLVQLPALVDREDIFREYAYFSSYSDSWVEHARRYAEAMIERLGLGPDSLVVELASNDGYLLQHFVARGIPVLGHRAGPERRRGRRAQRASRRSRSSSARDLARQLVSERGPRRPHRRQQRPRAGAGSERLRGRHHDPARAGRRGDARVPAPRPAHRGEPVRHDLPRALLVLLADHDHEDLRPPTASRSFDVDELPTHGGSLRVYAGPQRRVAGRSRRAVEALLERERAGGYADVDGLRGLRGARRARPSARLLDIPDRARGGPASRSSAYGAPGKGNTLLNYCGIRTDLLDYTVDRNPYKHGRFTPGTHIPIHRPDADRARPGPT